MRYDGARTRKVWRALAFSVLFVLSIPAFIWALFTGIEFDLY